MDFLSIRCIVKYFSSMFGWKSASNRHFLNGFSFSLQVNSVTRGERIHITRDFLSAAGVPHDSNMTSIHVGVTNGDWSKLVPISKDGSAGPLPSGFRFEGSVGQFYSFVGEGTFSLKMSEVLWIDRILFSNISEAKGY